MGEHSPVQSDRGIDFEVDFSEWFDSGHCADAVVICQDKQWEVHRVVLVQRNTWFRKALGGLFKEEREKETTIHEFEPQETEWLLRAIYSSNFKFLDPLQGDESEIHATCVSLYRLGDFFGVEKLMSFACSTLTTFHLRTAAAYQRAQSLANDRCRALNVNPFKFDHDPPNFPVDAFFEQAEVVYHDLGSDSFDRLRSEFAKGLSLMTPVFLRYEPVKKGLQNVPLLATDVLLGVGEAQPRTHHLPNVCTACRKGPLVGDDNLFINTWLSHRGIPEGSCVKCTRGEVARNYRAILEGKST